MGERLAAARAAYMADTNQGLTQIYNQLKDPKCDEPRILALRALHEETDRAVLDAYGWTDLPVPPFCPLSPEDQRALESFHKTVIDRLFVLNAERAAEEKRLGTGTNGEKRGKGRQAARSTGAGKRTRKPKGDLPDGQADLFTHPRGESS